MAVTEYAKEMRAGRWKSTHQGIAIGWDGKVVDGQHRLLAVIESGVSVEMLVTRGVDPETQDLVDGGRKRTVGDQLGLRHGIQNGCLVAASSRVIALISSPAFRGGITMGQATGILGVYQESITSMIAILGNFKPCRRAPIIGTLSFCHKALPGQVVNFAEKLAHGEGIKRGDPVYALRNHLINNSLPGSGKSAMSACEWVANALYNQVNNNPLTLIKRGVVGLDFFRAKQRGNVDTIRAIIGED